MLVFAHPDDETFLTGGVACRYADEGVRVVLVSATRGESGKAGDPPLCAPEELPALREEELRRATAILGIADVHLLGYRDRELAAAPPDEIREQLVTLIRRHQPSVVVTFDPNGGNAHPDHVAISRFTADAVAAAADPRWFPSAGPPHSIRAGRLADGQRPCGDLARARPRRPPRRGLHHRREPVARTKGGRVEGARHAASERGPELLLPAGLRPAVEPRGVSPGIRPAARAPAARRPLRRSRVR